MSGQAPITGPFTLEEGKMLYGARQRPDGMLRLEGRGKRDDFLSRSPQEGKRSQDVWVSQHALAEPLC